MEKNTGKVGEFCQPGKVGTLDMLWSVFRTVCICNVFSSVPTVIEYNHKEMQLAPEKNILLHIT